MWKEEKLFRFLISFIAFNRHSIRVFYIYTRDWAGGTPCNIRERFEQLFNSTVPVIKIKSVERTNCGRSCESRPISRNTSPQNCPILHRNCTSSSFFLSLVESLQPVSLTFLISTHDCRGEKNIREKRILRNSIFPFSLRFFFFFNPTRQRPLG